MEAKLFAKQLDGIVEKFKELDRSKQYDDFSGFPDHVAAEFTTLCLSAIHRITGPNSVYATQAHRMIDRAGKNECFAIPDLGGLIQALRLDVQNGHLRHFEELAHADIFSDFIEQADYLLESGFKDAAAVMTGGVLESHLRQLCLRHEVPIEVTNAKGDVIPKKADSMNVDLAKARIYSTLEQKSVVVWLDLRNKAAHGRYTEYAAENVRLMMDGVRQFLSRYPA